MTAYLNPRKYDEPDMKHAMRLLCASAIELEGRDLEHVSLARGDVLETAGAAVTHAYFFSQGFAVTPLALKGVI